uniref:Uncharacterized protein n=1 Tax=Anguilla anguilla TaxID=7936 RepID=A0A0E9RSQ6_ANGAN
MLSQRGKPEKRSIFSEEI